MNDMQPDRQQPADTDLEAPSKFVSALRQTQNQSVFVPPSVDATIRDVARAQLRRTTPRRFVWPRAAEWAAAAACVVLMVVVVFWDFRPGGRLAFAPEDINDDMVVDILDAFELAQRIERSDIPKKADFNHDGVVDRRDVDAIANKAVKLAKGGRS